ncbi:hypothetical protein [Robbsia andropogonis]|uniref:hypothetical protein n=1 Tax=Robbsia andropogonis TaxID=28092 RepID=UPI0012FAF69B|nr:hypothetical protein [Robbsia andropogonis]
MQSSTKGNKVPFTENGGKAVDDPECATQSALSRFNSEINGPFDPFDAISKMGREPVGGKTNAIPEPENARHALMGSACAVAIVIADAAFIPINAARMKNRDCCIMHYSPSMARRIARWMYLLAVMRGMFGVMQLFICGLYWPAGITRVMQSKCITSLH